MENFNISQLKELIREYYPISEESMKVLENSVHSFLMNSNTMLDYSTQKSELVPVFISKLFNSLENAGSSIKEIEEPAGTSTYRYKHKLRDIWDGLSFEYAEEEIMSLVIKGLCEDFAGKDLQIYTITPYFDRAEKEYLVYIRGVFN